MNKQNHSRAILAGIIGNSIFGLSFLASKIALSYTTPILLLFLRFGFTFIILNLLLLFHIAELHFTGKKLLPVILLGICQPVLYFLFENYGIQLTTSSFSGIMIGLVPIAGYFMGSLFLKELFIKNKFFWSVCSVLGVVFISLFGQENGSVTGLGILFLALAVLTAAFYNILSKGCSDDFSPFERTYIMFAVGFVSFSLISVLQYKNQLLPAIQICLSDMRVFLSVLYLALFSSVIAFFCLNYAVSYLTVQQATSYTNLTCVVSVAAGVFILHEPVSLPHIIGIVIIILSIYKFNKISS